MSNYSGFKHIEVSTPASHVRLVELAREPVNAFDENLWTNLGEAFDKINEDGDARAVVLASALPKLFTAGLDLKDTGALQDADTDTGRRALALRNHILRFQAAISAIERCRYPVILATHGLTLGLGVDIACACDVRYAAANTVFSIKEVDVGLAADIGSLARLPKIAGNESLIRELAYTARNFTAQEALSLGLVSKVIPGGRSEVVAAALETAKLIAAKSPIAVVGTKHLLLHSRDHSVAENLEYTAVWNAFALQATDMGDSLQAFQTKKPAKFSSLPKLHGKL